MSPKDILTICLQACLFQMALCQCAGFGPSQLGLPGPGQILPNGVGSKVIQPNLASPQNPGYGHNYGQYGPGYPGYGGSGSGDVAVAGELPVAGNTLVAGQVPVIGGVQFGGTLPAAGVITITGSCSCSPYY